MKRIDLRSDTVTHPSAAMKEAMCQAELGDDVWGDDPTAHAFQEEVADTLRKEASLFFPTATMANLTAILCHCQRGEEYIAADQAHCYRWEAGGAAVLGSVQPQTIDIETDGTLDLDKVASKIKPDDPHHAITRLLCIENTHYGKILPLGFMAEARRFCDRYGLKLHMDGARVFNAAVGLGVDVSTVVQHMDSVSFCLSKGLGCPMGALLVGKRELIQRAIRWRKMLGGGMRQTGMMAAAGQYALKNNVKRLADDHYNAERLAAGIQALNDPRLQLDFQATNMVFAKLAEELDGGLQEFAAGRGVTLPPGSDQRWVTHIDVHDSDIDTVLEVIREGLAANIEARPSTSKSLY